MRKGLELNLAACITVAVLELRMRMELHPGPGVDCCGALEIRCARRAVSALYSGTELV